MNGVVRKERRAAGLIPVVEPKAVPHTHSAGRQRPAIA
jgi:hypothetical protein